MTAYRVYLVDGSGRFVRADAVEAESDEDAVRQARTVMGASPKAEVWELGRHVATVDASSS